MANRLLLVPEIAARLGYDEAVTRRKLRNGEIPGARKRGLGRRAALVMLESDLEAWIHALPLASESQSGTAG